MIPDGMLPHCWQPSKESLMKVRLREDFSPCTAKDPNTGIGIPLIPGSYVDFTQIGIQAGPFMRAHEWAFYAEDIPKKPGRKAKVEQATASPGEERDR
jgi:hypothetical protein